MVARVGDDLTACEHGWPPGTAPSASYGWIHAARVAFAEADEAQTFTAESQGQILAATGLVGTCHRGIWRWSPPGRELAMPVDAVIANSRAGDCLARALVGCGRPLLIDRVPATSPILAAIRRASRGRALAIVRPAPGHLFVPLDETWIEPERHLLARQRLRLVSALRQIERLGVVRTEIHAPDLNELPGLLDLILDLDGARAGRQSAAMSVQWSEAVFFRLYAEAACVDGTLRICLLRVGDHVAAAQLGVEMGGALWLLKAGEDSRFADYRPAQILACETLRYASQANLDSCEFWNEEQSWMHAWTVQRRGCVSLRVYPLGLRGLSAALADACMAIGQRLRARLTR